MSHGICHLSLIPVRAEPSDKAEMVTQLLFGEHYFVLSESEKWVKIKTFHDDYEGFLDKKQLFEVNSAEFDELSVNKFPVVVEPVFTQFDGRNLVRRYLAGSILPFASKSVFKLRSQTLPFTGDVSDPQAETNHLIDDAKQFLGAPYLWGGKSVLGIDCSGFTQVVFRMSGKYISRDAYQQAEEGEIVNLVDESQNGDLAFFDNQEGRITHVGIVMKEDSERTIIHASGEVRIDKLDHQGIFNSTSNEYTHNLRLIKRLF